jgi:4-amino-4-deoxy-L-arabinose transferase-like glycosyltransferase
VTRARNTGAGRAIVAILLAAALLRIGFAGWVVGLDVPPRGDEIDYHAIAGNLIAGDGYAQAGGQPTARRPPAYPFLLTALYAVTGPNPAAGRLVQILLGLCVVWLTVVVARRVFGQRVALVAGALAALNPFLAFVCGYLLTENLYMVFVLAALAVAPTPEAWLSSWRRPLAAAGLIALAALARPTGLPIFEWSALAVLLLAAGSWRLRLARVALAAVIFALMLAPWIARNARVVGAPVLTTHGGITFYQGNNARVVDTPSWRGGVAPLDALPRYEELAGMPEIERDRMAWSLGRAYLASHPGEIPEMVAWKLGRFWRLQSDMGLSCVRSGWWWSTSSWAGRLASTLDVGFVYAMVAMPLFVAGLWLTRRRWRELVLVYGVIVVHTAIAAVFFGSLRSRIPVEPVMGVFAAVAAVALYDGFRKRRAVSRVPADSAPARR